MHKSTDETPQVQPQTVTAAGGSYDAAMKGVRELGASARQEWAMGELLQALAHDNQVLGWKRCEQPSLIPHDGVVSPGSDEQSLTAEYLRAVTYAVDIARKLEHLRSDTDALPVAAAAFAEAIRISGFGAMPSDYELRRPSIN